MQLSIRKIVPEDLNSIVLLIRNFSELERLSEYCEVDEDRLLAAMFAHASPVDGLIASDGDKAIGYALFYPCFSSFRGELGLHLEDLFVLDGYRGNGVGLALLREVAKIARERGLVRLDLMVQYRNLGAVKFYERLGAATNPDDRHFKFSGDAFRKLSS